ncbi:MAG: LacI family DNA-binding transcriptional regulator [Bifidobacterium sp.]|jgi:LacI family transcriptional regulator
MALTKRAGVSDVAKHAGVSIGTVSNYLNYPERVSETLKTKIRQSIAALGYEPRRPRAQLGNGTQTGKSEHDTLIGYVMTDIEHSLFTRIFEGIQEVCEDNCMQLIGTNAYSDHERQSELVRVFTQINVSGILLSTVGDPSDDILLAKAAGIPIVLVDHSNPIGAESTCCVLENNIACGQIAAEELIRTGCKHIVFASHSFDYESVQERNYGAKRAVERSNANVRFSTMDTGGILIEDGYQFGHQLNDMPDGERPDGIIAGTDRLAGGILNAITERGELSVPNDISIIGCEGADMEAFCDKPLTTVNAPGNDMGAKAMLQILDEIESPATHIHSTTLLDPQLKRRNTTRPVPTHMHNA